MSVEDWGRLELSTMTRAVSTLSISRRYLHDEVAERLRESILSGELEPRARINELNLCERFGISRTPLREAVKILATEGLLELLPNRGARVASISAEEVNEMLEVIGGLEATAADLACREVTDEEIAAIEVKHVAMVAAWRRKDHTGYLTLNRDIHDMIMRASRNATLQSIYANLSGRIQRARYGAHKTPEQWKRAIDEHELILELLKERKGEQLAVLLREHIRGKKPLILASYG
jgi:DNA-binding GntR family transcriptional regulator